MPQHERAVAVPDPAHRDRDQLALLGEAPASPPILGGALCIAGVVVAWSTRLPRLSALRGRSADAESPEPA
jgi:hypothetical protein